MEKFIETIHCKSRAHCRKCRSSKFWREDMMKTFEWDGKCPLEDILGDRDSEIQYQEEVLARMIKNGCKQCEIKRQREWIERLKSENS